MIERGENNVAEHQSDSASATHGKQRHYAGRIAGAGTN